MAREFRTKESYETELIRRDLVMPFLQQRGFRFSEDRRIKRGTSISQTLIGQDERGQSVSLWVRLCWRKEDAAGADAYSAAQLLANVDGDGWVEALGRRLTHARDDGVTHLLLLQNAGDLIQRLVAIPLSVVVPIWKAQREESRRLIERGVITRKKNHAENGRSPTLWLHDVKAPTVAIALTGHAAVRDLTALHVSIDQGLATVLLPALDDVFDDLAGLGRDQGVAHERVVAGYSRNQAVRKKVMKLSGYRCERPGCTAVRVYYPGALDSHHILGIAESDRVSNCVALCPNCHRDAHFHPEKVPLNALLLQVAQSRRSR